MTIIDNTANLTENRVLQTRPPSINKLEKDLPRKNTLKYTIRMVDDWIATTPKSTSGYVDNPHTTLYTYFIAYNTLQTTQQGTSGTTSRKYVLASFLILHIIDEEMERILDGR